MSDRYCRTYWSTHACRYDRGHDPVAQPHACDCCTCANHPDSEDCVGASPYYGPATRFWGEDVPGAES